MSEAATVDGAGPAWPPPTLEEASVLLRKRTLDMFYATHSRALPDTFETSKIRVAAKVLSEYECVALPERLPHAVAAARARVSAQAPGHAGVKMLTAGLADAQPILMLTDVGTPAVASAPGSAAAGAAGVAASTKPMMGVGGVAGGAVVGGGVAAVVDAVVAGVAARHQPQGVSAESVEELKKAEELAARAQAQSRAIVERRTPAKVPEPKWHAPWVLSRVVSGHLGWVRAVAVDPSNEWFVTGAADRTIKVWDLASGALKITLTGHINTVRALSVSSRHPYMFSAGEDKLVKCWDLEQNRIIRDYHGHLSGVYALALHPTLDILMTGGRDSVCRVWDIRTKAAVHVLGGHENSIASILTNGTDPQVVTGSMDNTIRTWDLRTGKVMTVLTHHKKAVRAMVNHTREFAFVSGAADNLKKWALPNGDFVHNFYGHNSIINALALNADDVLVSGGDDGSLKFWDYGTGYSFQEIQSKVQPGSLDAEAGIYAMAFDQSGSRLITCEADKTIKIWREDPDASPDTHPIDMKAWTSFVRMHKRY